MNYIFFDSKVWRLHPGELPVKPEKPTGTFCMTFYHADLEKYDKSIADIKANALEIDNPEISEGMNFSSPVILHGDIVFYQWPGSYKKKWVKKHYMDLIEKEVAHLVLPPEEKNMKTDNQIIAEFMGEPLTFTHDNCGVVSEIRMSYDDYYDEWNNLMPVVDKIEDLTGTSKEVGNLLSAWSYYYKIFNGTINTDIKVAYQIVVEFIKWYNHQTP